MEAFWPYGGYALAVDSEGAAYVAGDNRMWGLSAPHSTISKLGPQGEIAATGSIDGLVKSIATGDGGGIVLLGSTWVGRLSATPGAPVACPPYAGTDFADTFYVARLDPRSLSPGYLGYLPARAAWMAGPDRVVAAGPYSPYSTLLPYAVLPVGPPAPGTVTCVANAANYASNAVSPGELVSVFGVGIGPATPTVARLDAEGNIASELDGVRVFAGGLPAPLLYAAPSQINLAMPFGIAGEKARLEIYRDGTRVAAFDKLLVSQHPGVFSADTPVRGPLAALNQDGSVNNASNPAAPGSIISIFVTGLGAMTPPLPDGTVALRPANVPASLPQVLVNGQPAEILYIGNAPGVVQGVVQINLRLPDLIPPAFGTQPGAPYVSLKYAQGSVPAGTVAVR
jgi:uncharacterized protein (TIGR03437 family)